MSSIENPRYFLSNPNGKGFIDFGFGLFSESPGRYIKLKLCIHLGEGI